MSKDFFAVLSGGGVKGAALIGAYEEAQNRGVKFVGWGGTSAGSIVAALLACGYSVADLRERLYEAPYSEFFLVKKRRLMFFNYYRGMVDPAPLLEWLRGLIGKKFPDRPRVTFNDLKDGQYLKIVAANITTQEILIYGKRNTPTTEIAQAVLASCSFPLLFPPVSHGNDEIVDGGVLSNFPMWLFDDEHDEQKKFTPVLGFTLISRAKRKEQASILTHAFSVFDSVLVAQDRIQEKYMDIARLANVIRIDVGQTPTFSTTQSRDQHDRLILAGKDAASKFFVTATVNFGEPEEVPFVPMSVEMARKQANEGDYQGAVSTIARQHIVRGGVARDHGLLEERVLVKYYIDLMAAVTDHGKLEILAQVLAEKMKDLSTFDRIVGIKKGNIILAYAVAQILKKPISLFKTDMSYKMGPPFDGPITAGENVVIVDDIASDASILLSAVRHLHFRHAAVQSVVTLIERTEGDAYDKIMKDRGVRLISVCSVDDEAIRRLIVENLSFREGQKFSALRSA
jgi:NTE family protein